jgi:aconitate hydratase
MASHSDPKPHPNSFGAQSVLSVNGRDYEIFDLTAEALTSAYDVARLPYAIKVLLENLLRHEDSPHVAADDIAATASWGANPEAHGQAAGDAAHEIALTPERVLMQDFTGVPGVVDLAAMRDALARLGGNASQVNPLVPVELVIDHSVIAESSGDASSYDTNVSIEYERNMER